MTTAQRRFFLIAALSMLLIAGLAWLIVLRDWLLLVVAASAVPPTLERLLDSFRLAWPGSRLDSWRGLSRLRFSNAQTTAAGIVLFALLITPLIVLYARANVVILAAVGLIFAVSLVRLAWAVLAEGWSGRKRDQR